MLAQRTMDKTKDQEIAELRERLAQAEAKAEAEARGRQAAEAKAAEAQAKAEEESRRRQALEAKAAEAETKRWVIDLIYRCHKNRPCRSYIYTRRQ